MSSRRPVTPTTRGRGGSPPRAPKARSRPRPGSGRASGPEPTRRPAGRGSSAKPANGAKPTKKAATAGARRGGRQGWHGAGDPRRRVTTLLGVLTVLFAVAGVRLVWVQLLGADRYVRYGDGQRVDAIQLVAGRGAIFDRNGIELAMTRPQRTVVADPRLITEPRETAATLARLLHRDEAGEQEIYEHLTRDAAFAYIARRVPDDVADSIEAEELDGISFVEEDQRYNPAGSLARSVLGQVGVDNEGLSALELQYDDELSGTPGELVLERDLQGRTIPAGRHDLDPAEAGEDLILTLDRGLQHEAEQVMAEAIASTGSRAGTAIVTNPETGEIYALVNMEVNAQTGQVADSGNNLAVTANYEPGSVNKVVTLAAAIEEGVVTPDTPLQVPDSLQVADHTFTDSHTHPVERWTVTDILTESSNVGTIMVAQELGSERLAEYLQAFGFGEATALGFPAEAVGAYPAPEDWSGTSIGTIPLGQGISVTAMQMLYAYNAIANDGVYVPPRLVGEIVDAHGERRDAPAGQSRRVVSQDTASQMRQMMANVVAAGTGEAAAIDGYQVAGKTGTARKPAPGGGYVWDDGRMHYISTFAGFIPAEDPKLSIIVVLDEPDSTFASTSAAPAFRELAQYALRHMQVPPIASSTVAEADSGLVRGRPAAGPPPVSSTVPPPPAATIPPTSGAGGATPRRPVPLPVVAF